MVWALCHFPCEGGALSILSNHLNFQTFYYSFYYLKNRLGSFLFFCHGLSTMSLSLRGWRSFHAVQSPLFLRSASEDVFRGYLRSGGKCEAAAPSRVSKDWCMCDASACPRMCFQGTAMFSEIIGLLFHAVSGVLEFFPSRVARLLSQEDISIEGCARMRNTLFPLRHIYIYICIHIYIYNTYTQICTRTSSIEFCTGAWHVLFEMSVLS